MKIIKVLGVVLLVLVLLVAGVVAAAFIWIDSIAKEGVERGAGYALAVPTTLESADVNILGGGFAMDDLRVRNPGGFSEEHFLTLDDTDVQVDLATLMKDEVKIPSIEMRDIDITLLRQEGKTNYSVILENLKRFESGETQEPKDAPGKTFIIGKLAIHDIKAHVSLFSIGGEATTVEVVVPEIVLTDIGSDGSGVKLGELTNIVIQAVIASVVNAKGMPEDIARELRGQLDDLSALAKEQIGIAVDLGNGLLEKINSGEGELGDRLQEAAQEGRKQVEDAVEEGKKAVDDVIDEGKKTIDQLRDRIPKRK